MLRVLIACECSGRIREEFTKVGCDAWSCDLNPTDLPGQHLQCDVREILQNDWDLVIAHPPCRYLASMGIWWNHKRPDRWPETYKALDFVKTCWDANSRYLAIENPIGYLNKNWQKPAQIIHPWQHGDEASKPTCLWLKNLPLVTPTKIVSKGEFYTKANGTRMAKWSHITSGTKKDLRAKIAATTFPGIAKAMATQWTAYILENEGITNPNQYLDIPQTI